MRSIFSKRDRKYCYNQSYDLQVASPRSHNLAPLVNLDMWSQTLQHNTTICINVQTALCQHPLQNALHETPKFENPRGPVSSKSPRVSRTHASSYGTVCYWISLFEWFFKDPLKDSLIEHIITTQESYTRSNTFECEITLHDLASSELRRFEG